MYWKRCFFYYRFSYGGSGTMWLSAGYISSVARRSLTNSMRLINRIRARWFSFSGYYSSPHISKTAYLKQLIKGAASSVTLSFRSAEPVFSLRLPCCESPLFRFPLSSLSPPPVNQLFRPPTALSGSFPLSLLPFLPSLPFTLWQAWPMLPLPWVCRLSAVNHLSVLIQCNLIIKCKLTYIYILILIVLSLQGGTVP